MTKLLKMFFLFKALLLTTRIGVLMDAKKKRMVIFPRIRVIPTGPNIVIRYGLKTAFFNLHFDELFTLMHFLSFAEKDI